jgi:hypothetical protein
MNAEHTIIGPSSSPTTGELVKALSKAQAEFPVVELDAANPHFRSKFASFRQCSESLRGPLCKHGLSLPDYLPGFMGNQPVLVGTLRHGSGEYLRGVVPLLAGKQDMQGYGAAVTYAKRTLLMALTGAFSGEVDDDGESNRVSSAASAAVAQHATAQAANALQREQDWKRRIVAASDPATARKVMQEVELRLREKAIDRGVYERCKAEYDKRPGPVDPDAAVPLYQRIATHIQLASAEITLKKIITRIAELEKDGQLTSDEAVELREHVAQRADEVMDAAV